MRKQLINGLPAMSFSEATRDALAASDAKIVITGARGWIGYAAVSMLETVFAGNLRERVILFGAKRNSLILRSGLTMAVNPLTEIVNLNGEEFLFAHLAFLTREHIQSYGVEEYVKVNRAISTLAIDFANRVLPSGLFLPSSGAIYDENGVPEEHLDRNPYGFLKLQDEIHFSELDTDNSKTAVMRVFNLSGPFLNKPNGYVLGTILKDLARGTVVNIDSDYEVVRSYIHVRDVVEIAFSIMLGVIPGPGTPFDTAGEQVVEIQELAELAAWVLGIPHVTINRPELNSRKSRDYYVGDGRILMELVKQQQLKLASLVNQIRDTAHYLFE